MKSRFHHQMPLFLKYTHHTTFTKNKLYDVVHVKLEQVLLHTRNLKLLLDACVFEDPLVFFLTEIDNLIVSYNKSNYVFRFISLVYAICLDLFT